MRGRHKEWSPAILLMYVTQHYLRWVKSMAQVDRVGCLVQRLALQELYAPRWGHAARSGAVDDQEGSPLLLTGILEGAQGGLTPAHEQEAALLPPAGAGASSGVSVLHGETPCSTEPSAGQLSLADLESASSNGEAGAGAAACPAAALYVSPWRAPDDGHLICRGGPVLPA